MKDKFILFIFLIKNLSIVNKPKTTNKKIISIVIPKLALSSIVKN